MNKHSRAIFIGMALILFISGLAFLAALTGTSIRAQKDLNRAPRDRSSLEELQSLLITSDLTVKDEHLLVSRKLEANSVRVRFVSKPGGSGTEILDSLPDESSAILLWGKART
ncbi:MAG: hypothetical protein WBD22_01770, partial [Pyrinomonadaceae bacterium]